MNRGGVNCKKGTNKICVPREMRKEVLEMLNGPSKGKPVKGKLPAQLKPFAKIRDQVRAENPGLPYSEVLKLASRIYQKKKGLEQQGYKQKVIPAGKDKGKKVFAKKIDNDEWDDSGDDYNYDDLTFESEDDDNESVDDYNYDDLTFGSEEEEELIPKKKPKPLPTPPQKKMQEIEINDNSYVPKLKDNQPYELVFSEPEFNDDDNILDFDSDSGNLVNNLSDDLEDLDEEYISQLDIGAIRELKDKINFVVNNYMRALFDDEDIPDDVDAKIRTLIAYRAMLIKAEMNYINKGSKLINNALSLLDQMDGDESKGSGYRMRKNQGSGFYGMHSGQMYAPNYYQTPYYNMRY